MTALLSPMAWKVFHDTAEIQKHYAMLLVDLGRMNGGIEKAMARLEKMSKKGNKFAERDQQWMKYDLQVAGDPLGDAKSAVKKSGGSYASSSL